MTSYSAELESSTLGDMLRATRMRRGLDLLMVAEETKISPKNLQAMEDGDLASLPAEVYTRGFYAMYARILALDPGEVLERYRRERQELPATAGQPTPPPSRRAQDFAILAERPDSPPSSYFGLIIFLFLLFGGFLCWYFGWNPASYLSEKLRSLEGPRQIEQVKNEAEPDLIFGRAMTEAPPPMKPESLTLFSPSSVTAATTQPAVSPSASAAAVPTPYVVHAFFGEEAEVSLAIDNQPPQTFSCKDGETRTWQAGERLILTLPGDTRTRLSLNNVPLALPKAVNDKVTLSIPAATLR